MPSVRLLTDLVDTERLRDAGVELGQQAITDGRQSLSWGEYCDRVARLAGALVSCGVDVGDRVGVRLPKSCESFAAAHAVLRAGAVLVPIDPLAPVDNAASVLADAGIRLVVTDVRNVELIGALSVVEAVVCPGADVAPTLDSVAVLGETEIAACAPVNPPAGVEPTDPAYVIYTSGSTGVQKGIVHSHASALAYALTAAEVYGLAPTDRLANIAPLHFDQSTFELYASVVVGASVLVVPDPVLRFPASVAELIERERVTVWYSVPFLLEQLAVRGALEDRDLRSLRLVLYGGESFEPSRLADLMHRLPGVAFSNVYGPAEVNQCMIHNLHDPPATDRPVPIGRAWPAAELRLLDPDDPRRAADQDPALLAVATPTMMSGYWNRPDLTAASIVVDPDGTRWYLTGDLVRHDERGDLVFVGRSDHQVKVRGHRVELEAVDATLLAVAGVAEAVTVVDRRSAGDDRLAALIVVDAAAGTDSEVVARVRQTARDRLPRAAVPADIRVVIALPRTASGKVDRVAATSLMSEDS